MEKLFLGGDWARVSDYSWFAVTNEFNDVVGWIKTPHMPYERQIEILLTELKKPIKATRKKPDGTEEEYTCTLFERIVGVRGIRPVRVTCRWNT